MPIDQDVTTLQRRIGQTDTDDIDLDSSPVVGSAIRPVLPSIPAQERPEKSSPRTTILTAYEAVENAIAAGKPESEIKTLQRRLRDVRAAVAEQEALDAEREMIGGKVATRRAHDENLRRLKIGAAAADKARRQDAFVLVTSFDGIVVRCFPTRIDDFAVRAQVEHAFMKTCGWFAQMAERKVAAARQAAMSMGRTKVQEWRSGAIVARLRDDHRVGLNHSCVTISDGS